MPNIRRRHFISIRRSTSPLSLDDLRRYHALRCSRYRFARAPAGSRSQHHSPSADIPQCASATRRTCLLRDQRPGLYRQRLFAERQPRCTHIGRGASRLMIAMCAIASDIRVIISIYYLMRYCRASTIKDIDMPLIARCISMGLDSSTIGRPRLAVRDTAFSRCRRRTPPKRSKFQRYH